MSKKRKMEKEKQSIGGSSEECCMCGDSGLSSHLFTCKLCLFRSQHMYCSNLYPETKSYDTCNWCLIQSGNSKSKATLLNYSSSRDKAANDGSQMKKALGNGNNTHGRSLKDKKSMSELEGTGQPASKKRVVIDRHHGGIAKRIITRSQKNMSNDGNHRMVVRRVFRNKVPRYKLLDEVSS